MAERLVDRILSVLPINRPSGLNLPNTMDVGTPVGIFAGAHSNTRFWDSEFSPYYYTRFRGLNDYTEPSFYSDYEESYRTNPFTNMFIEYVVTNTLGNGYHFEGPGANVCERFWEADQTEEKLEMQFRNACIFGNGLMDYTTKGVRGRLVKTRVLNTYEVVIDVERDITKSDYGERTYWQGANKLRGTHVNHLLFRELTGQPYGMSILRPNIVFLQALLDAGGDVFSAIKRTAYAPIVVKLDLDGFRTAEEKKDAMDKFEEKMKKQNSAVTNLILDKRHDANLLGVGSAGARLLPTNQLIEPWIAVVLRNLGMPIGIFLQQGANKAIVQAQREDVRGFFNLIKRRVKNQVDRQLLPRITERRAWLVWDKPPPNTPETQEEMKTIAMMFQLGLISREYFLDVFDIEDEGTTFYEKEEMLQRTSHDLAMTKIQSPYEQWTFTSRNAGDEYDAE